MGRAGSKVARDRPHWHSAPPALLVSLHIREAVSLHIITVL